MVHWQSSNLGQQREYIKLLQKSLKTPYAIDYEY